jgi:hypothetical protein
MLVLGHPAVLFCAGGSLAEAFQSGQSSGMEQGAFYSWGRIVAPDDVVCSDPEAAICAPEPIL